MIDHFRLRPGALGALFTAFALAMATPAAAQLVAAAADGDLQGVRALLSAGADVGEVAGDGMTALHWAAEHGHAEMTALLLRAGAATDGVTRLGSFRPLHLAARSGDSETVRLLLDAGADPAAPTGVAGATPLHYAALAGDVVSVGHLLAEGAPVDARETEWGQTPLMFAASANRVGAIAELLDGGADIAAHASVLDIRQRELEDRAARRRTPVPNPDPPAADSLGRDVRLTDPPDPREGPSNSYTAMVRAMGGLTPLLIAVREGHTDAVETLLARGANLEQPSQGDDTRPLLMATINGHFDLALDLLRRGADPNATSYAGAAPLYTTLNAEWIPKTRHPQPADYMQQETSYLELMRELLDAGADPNARLLQELWYTTYTNDLLGVDRRGATPFWRAAHATDLRAMELLVSYGADPHLGTMVMGTSGGGRGGGGLDPSGLPRLQPGDNAVMPIHAASGVGHGQGYAGNAHRHVPDGWLPAVRYLVETHGADVNARDINGYTPLHHAAARGDSELVLYLVEKGADVTAVSRRGQTTADMANGPVQRLSPYLSTITLLEKLGARNNHRCVGC